MRFQNAYVLGLHRRTIKIPRNSRIVAIPSSVGQAKINQKTGTREAPQHWKVLHETSKKETADSRYIADMKKKYGSNIKDWPDKIPTIDEETLTQTTFKLPTKFNLKVKK